MSTDGSSIIKALCIRENEKEGSIFITLPAPDDYTFTHDNWASDLSKRYHGPYRVMTIDLAHCRSVNSILCAGFIHLYRTYGCEQAILLNANRNVKNILHTLQLDQVFSIEY